jgi:hypothetical protein
MFEFGVISRFRQKMLAVKGMVRLTESELAVLYYCSEFREFRQSERD